MNGLRLSGVVLNSREPRKLAAFYCRLLDLEPDQDSEHWVSVVTRQGVRLSFHHDEDYRPPVWPSRDAEQQMMLHLDIDVDDLEAACAHAVRAGARPADFQPQDPVRVMLDPDGHPFCLAELSGSTRS
ncbi:VOC family protein [Kutzneria kofuensis]|uniref:Catechol 2,3-dioxygenase-like lactoylglutathione lyase family enzyme n=1 Tax=Kutzneria kofuensis TaxID=103725 RepID=A0A7W9KQW4_9PSEU|nr:VOC family protein [Kutzneria kofuensis]MBB5897077.1 catechol 2,3-dioxygenase-like lactoylglutathione lyase family enzyme [Kutzneria kofuensis]